MDLVPMFDPYRVHQDFVVDGRTMGRMVSLRRFEAARAAEVARLPVSLRIILESVLRNLGRPGVEATQAEAIAGWKPQAGQRDEVSFTVARVLLQDISGIPVLLDLSAMRSAMVRRGFDAGTICPRVPVDLVIDHSIQVDRAGTADALDFNTKLEFKRNGERYGFLKWASQAFANLRILPPGVGIIHQVHLEYLARGVMCRDGLWYPDTLLGTDSHTPMVNGLGIVGWGVGGIEATAALLGAPVPLLLPDVIGIRLDSRPRVGVTATDIVLTLTQLLRREKVVGQFLEFYGEGARHLSVPDRATIANMAPEYGASLAYFPADEKTSLYYLLTGRDAEAVALSRAYLEQQGLYGIGAQAECDYSREIVLDLRDVEPCIAGPRKPEERLRLADVATAFEKIQAPKRAAADRSAEPLRNGDILLAAITSCTNTSNPPLMIAAGLLARNAVSKGLRVNPRIKTSFAPGSRAVVRYLERAGLLQSMRALGFHVVGYGCTTCMGSSGPLAPELEEALSHQDVVGVAVLSGNRNFEARIHPKLRANFLMSPPLVIAYALAGRVDVNLLAEPLGQNEDDMPVYLEDIWPDAAEIAEATGAAEDPQLYRTTYGSLNQISPFWDALRVPTGPVYAGDATSSYMREPPFFELAPDESIETGSIVGARALAILGHGVTTDHISPVGRIAADSPAGEYLQRIGVRPTDFNTYGARRSNHEVMVRSMFANGRLGNAMADREGGFTRHYPSAEIMTIYDAAMAYQRDGVATLVFAGDEYGTGSSRDWAAKGLRLLGVKAVVAEGFERIHRSNLVGMGILPCQFAEGTRLADLNLRGDETFDLLAKKNFSPRESARLIVRRADGGLDEVALTIRIDTEVELDYIRHGGVLPYLMQRQILAAGADNARAVAAEPRTVRDA